MAPFSPARDADGNIIVDTGTRQPLASFLPPTGTPTPTDHASASSSRRWPALLAAGATISLLIAFAIWRGQPAAALPAPTATVAPTSAPSATVLALARAVVAYAEPGGTAIGAIEPGRHYDLVAERGDWRQLQVAGSGPVWVRAWEMDGLAPPTPPPTASPQPTVTLPPTPVYVPPTAVPTRDWAQQPCDPSEVVGRASGRGLVVESCISQEDAERLLSELLAKTAEAKP